MEDKKKFGFKQSKIDGSELIFGAGLQRQIPEKYSLEEFLPPVINQGNATICVPVSISAYLNWKENLKDGSKKDNHINYFELYDLYGEAEGMTFKDAFRHLRHSGIASDAGVLKIGQYARIKSSFALRFAILMNGPCFGALPVYNETDNFWIKREGDELLAFHAIAIVGYDNNGFIIRNSWGGSFGSEGYTKIPNEDFGKFIELWSIIN